jgi:hypothetical protein
MREGDGVGREDRHICRVCGKAGVFIGPVDIYNAFY